MTRRKGAIGGLRTKRDAPDRKKRTQDAFRTTGLQKKAKDKTPGLGTPRGPGISAFIPSRGPAVRKDILTKNRTIFLESNLGIEGQPFSLHDCLANRANFAKLPLLGSGGEGEVRLVTLRKPILDARGQNVRKIALKNYFKGKEGGPFNQITALTYIRLILDYLAARGINHGGLPFETVVKKGKGHSRRIVTIDGIRIRVVFPLFYSNRYLAMPYYYPSAEILRKMGNDDSIAQQQYDRVKKVLSIVTQKVIQTASNRRAARQLTPKGQLTPDIKAANVFCNLDSKGTVTDVIIMDQWFGTSDRSLLKKSLKVHKRGW